MQYRDFLKRSYNIVINNPLLWIFGLFLSGGFNLNLFYIIAMMRKTPGGVVVPLREVVNTASWWEILVICVGSLCVLTIMNWVKTIFLIETHEHLHEPGKNICSLCVTNESKKNWIARLPNFYIVAQVVLASIITAMLGIILALPINHLITHDVQTLSPIGFSVTMVASLILFCIVACWNMFTALYIIYHQMNFRSASKAAIDLLMLRTKNIFEYGFLLLIVYGALVVVGSVFIVLSQLSLSTLSIPLESLVPFTEYVTVAIKIIGTVGFWVWLAITNVFFNICLVLFFDGIVKAVSKPKEVGAMPAAPMSR